MQYKNIIRILGLLVALLSVTMLPPAMVSMIYRDGGGVPFLMGFLCCLFTGFLAWYPFRGEKTDLKSREGFLIVVLFWLVLASFSAIPLILLDQPSLSVTDAFFESFSGLTTTGATILNRIDGLPHAVLWYRQQLQWLGGMGIIVLAVAVLPMLGIGGMQLYRAEIPGPVKDSKMTPRIADTAKHLWYIYLSLTVACAAAYWLAGMSVFDAICHSFSTVAIGGFSTHDASMGYFNSPTINLVCVFFLIIASVNFALHYAVVQSKSLRNYFADPEFKAFLAIQVVLTLICFTVLMTSGTYQDADKAFDQALFQSVSISTTAGFSTTSFADWPTLLPLLLIFSSFIGGCAASTAGGMKVVRVLLLYLQGLRELNKLVHPRAIFKIKMGKKVLPDRVVEAVWGFFSAYAAVFVICMLLLLATGMDDITAFTAVAAAINNLGPGLGEVAANFSGIGDASKWVLIMAMLFGRLEVFTLLVLFTPGFWRT
ncbi:TrkH family potassium uptake protein [Colwellia sp. 4_MG-2023]|uniref:TrkH family potassium uptake protein n=1 Tax=unclassified Colwellia TaxID=196834 RepID=UPI001C09E94E|nr:MULTISPECIES: TrkH family potassium uptake protein [unclassified Colwellia]MBU2923500.1 TrkH family potassium uptake protein [Colwellia sp. C2M11]MDO6486073.1 TrkH family potassium uptake protein [Colwellia sp. 6_MG-2023]MDO6505970.1 TrkH family potassium uptake protein [Colwellia sp. 5_MG-2023]MDO6554651.1 TrkH family potassium uptake protein [Colwellia sp. 4_MG-2023]MDO6653326.1 TrkH family potassium uptake protein [Colwellia sp. 3_MG-2023]